MIELQLRWCERSLPTGRGALYLPLCDGGQFMFDDTRLAREEALLEPVLREQQNASLPVLSSRGRPL